MGLFRPPTFRRLPRFFCAAAAAFATFFLACYFVRVFLGFLVARFLCGVLPVFLHAVFLVLTILFCSLKYNASLGIIHFPDLSAISKVRSFPLGFFGPLEVEGCAPFKPSTLLFLMGDGSGVVWVLVFGVELNSEQFSTKSKSEQPVWSSTGATKHKMRQLSFIWPQHLTKISKEI